MKMENLINELIEDIINTSDDDILKEVEEDFGNKDYESKKFKEILNTARKKIKKLEKYNKKDRKMNINESIKYKHNEAFCLMKYKCEKCGDIEYIWNSRDGVTPFSVSCNCKEKGLKQHIEWNNDICIPDLKPMGIRWFVDMTKERYQELIDLKKIFFKNLEYNDIDIEDFEKSALDTFDSNEPDIYDPREKKEKD
jgi:hypothetical protein